MGERRLSLGRVILRLLKHKQLSIGMCAPPEKNAEAERIASKLLNIKGLPLTFEEYLLEYI